MATKGTAWVLKRPTDLVPGLLALAIKEAFTAQPELATATMECAAAEPDARQAR